MRIDNKKLHYNSKSVVQAKRWTALEGEKQIWGDEGAWDGRWKVIEGEEGDKKRGIFERAKAKYRVLGCGRGDKEDDDSLHEPMPNSIFLVISVIT